MCRIVSGLYMCVHVYTHNNQGVYVCTRTCVKALNV